MEVAPVRELPEVGLGRPQSHVITPLIAPPSNSEIIISHSIPMLLLG
jgi:hypothetical protein